MPQTSFTLPIRTISSQRGWTSGRFPRKTWGSLPPTPPLTSAHPLWVDATSISSRVILFGLPIRDSLLALHPLLNVIGHTWSLGVPCFSPWVPWPSGLHFLLYHSLKDGVATFLYGFPQGFSLCRSPSQLNGPPKPNSTFHALQYGSPSFLECLLKNRFPARLLGVCQWSNILPMHGMVGIDCLLLLPALPSLEYNSIFCLWE